MKANELRIGNWIIDTSDEECQIESIVLTDAGYNITVNDFHFDVAVEDISPIPLTGEWLLKFGFAEDKAHDCYVIYQHESVSFAIEYFDGQLQLVGHDLADSIEHIKYVHQLQNLYFALTGEELEITEKL